MKIYLITIILLLTACGDAKPSVPTEAELKSEYLFYVNREQEQNERVGLPRRCNINSYTLWKAARLGASREELNRIRTIEFEMMMNRHEYISTPRSSIRSK